MTVHKLCTGWLHVRFPGGFAQVPPAFNEEQIPDEHIFHPEWNRDRVNLWWVNYRQAAN